MYRTEWKEQRVCLVGKGQYGRSDRNRLLELLAVEPDDAVREVYAFLADWFDGNDKVVVQTSGSTGVPKQMWVRKEDMVASAVRTCRFFGLTEKDTALLCMNMKYIGARMMVVRALVSGMKLRVCPATSNPLLYDVGPVDFLAVVPLQLHQMMAHPDAVCRLSCIRHVIVGGAGVEASLVERLQSLPCAVYATYGMTETLSHVALRCLNGPKASDGYFPLPGIDIHAEADGTLTVGMVLDGCRRLLHTHDVAVFRDDGSFVLCGRTDNIVNSGGIKIQLETVERELSSCLSVPYALTSVPDGRLGEALVLLLQASWNEGQLQQLKEHMKSKLPPYHAPRHVLTVGQLPLTETGKVDRGACRRLATACLIINNV